MMKQILMVSVALTLLRRPKLKKRRNKKKTRLLKPRKKRMLIKPRLKNKKKPTIMLQLSRKRPKTKKPTMMLRPSRKRPKTKKPTMMLRPSRKRPTIKKRLTRKKKQIKNKPMLMIKRKQQTRPKKTTQMNRKTRRKKRPMMQRMSRKTTVMVKLTLKSQLWDRRTTQALTLKVRLILLNMRVTLLSWTRRTIPFGIVLICPRIRVTSLLKDPSITFSCLRIWTVTGARLVLTLRSLLPSTGTCVITLTQLIAMAAMILLPTQRRQTVAAACSRLILLKLRLPRMSHALTHRMARNKRVYDSFVLEVTFVLPTRRAFFPSPWISGAMTTHHATLAVSRLIRLR